MSTESAQEIEALPVAAMSRSPGLPLTALAGIMLAHMAVDMQTSSLAVLLPPLLTTFNLTYASAAGIISANNLVIAIAQPLFGMFGDYHPTRWLVWAGCVLCGLTMATVMFMPSYALVILAVILSGLGSAAFHPEALSSVRAISGDQQATGSSFFFFAGNLGFAFGPLMAAVLLERLGNYGAVWLLIPIALGVLGLWSQRRHYTSGAATSPASVRPATHQARPHARTLAVVGFLLLFIAVRLAISGGLTTFIPLYFSSHLSQAEIARMLTVLSIMGTVGTLFSGPMADRIGRRAVIVLSMGLGLVGLYIFLHTTGVAQLVALGVSSAVMSAPWTLSVIMMQEALPNNVGLASGLSLGTAYGAMGLGVAALGQLADGFGLPFTMQLITVLPVVVLLMGLFAPERQRK